MKILVICLIVVSVIAIGIAIGFLIKKKGRVILQWADENARDLFRLGLKTFKEMGSTAKKILLWCVGIILLPVLFILFLALIKITAWMIGPLIKIGGQVFDQNTNGILWAIVGVIILGILLQGKRWIPSLHIGSAGTAAHRLLTPFQKISWRNFVIWMLVEWLVIAIVSKYWSVSGDALWAWTKNNWLWLLPAHLLLGFIVFRKSSGHAGGGHGHVTLGTVFKGIRLWLIPVGVFLVLIQIATGLSRVMYPIDPPPSAATVTPIPQIDPNTIRMGTWEEVVPIGEYSKWAISHDGYNTQGKLSAPAKYLRGKLVGKEVVVYDMPLKWERPGIDKVYIAYGEAIRYFNEGTNDLKIKWSRAFK